MMLDDRQGTNCSPDFPPDYSKLFQCCAFEKGGSPIRCGNISCSGEVRNCIDVLIRNYEVNNDAGAKPVLRIRIQRGDERMLAVR